jgi:hypothetical protein
MKKMMIVMVILAAASSVHAAYTYTYGPGQDFASKTLYNSDSVLIAGGQGTTLTLFNSSYARIESTTPLGTNPKGGVWTTEAAGASTLDVFSGEVGEIAVLSNAEVRLYGGRLNYLYSYQQVPTVSDKHIDIFCKSYGYNSTSGILTGTWGDDSAFSIQLVNVSGYTPAIDNINFTIVPEPLSLSLLALGGLLVRRYR